MQTITHEFLMAGTTTGTHGWNKDQMKVLGIGWPLASPGEMKRLKSKIWAFQHSGVSGAATPSPGQRHLSIQSSTLYRFTLIT